MEKITLTTWEIDIIAMALDRLPSTSKNWSEDASKQIQALADRFDVADSVVIMVK
jgi:hypothetical protein